MKHLVSRDLVRIGKPTAYLSQFKMQRFKTETGFEPKKSLKPMLQENQIKNVSFSFKINSLKILPFG